MNKKHRNLLPACALLLVALVCARPSAASEPSDPAAAARVNQAGTLAQAESGPTGLDVVLLLDCSGKMKLIDPHDYRKPAAKLFISLLGEEDRISIIGFGDTARELAPLTRNSRANREKLFAGVDNITSKEFNTNITEAVQKAYGILKASPGKGRVIVLLSDGTLDLGSPSKDEAAHEELMKLMPLLSRAEIRIHAIAFTELGDMKLLNELAKRTRGSAALVRNDRDLHVMFASMFEKIKSPDALPLKGDTVIVDETIREMTLLITKGPGDHTSLTDPLQHELNRETRLDNMTWYETDAFDMITIDTPAVGTWKVHVGSAEGNRIFVVTDLKLKSSVPPDVVPQGGNLSIDAWLEKSGVPVQEKEFLDRVAFFAEMLGPDGAASRIDLRESAGTGQSGPRNGSYAAALKMNRPGTYHVKIRAEGKTFQREKTYQFRVEEPGAPPVRYLDEEIEPPTSSQTEVEPQASPQPDTDTLPWTYVLAPLAAINACLLCAGLIGYAVYRVRNRRGKKLSVSAEAKEK
jgi:Mg-chelatase subunit ChlD